MTDSKLIEQEYNKNIALLWKIVLSKDLNTRITYGKMLLEKLKDSKTASEKIYQMSEEVIDKLTQASQTIMDQNDLLECCYSALGDRAYDIVNTWKQLKKIKENRLKRKD